MTNDRTDKHLDKLVSSGDISSYTISKQECEPGSGSLEWDTLKIVFPSGKELNIETACSGSLQNVSMHFDIT